MLFVHVIQMTDWQSMVKSICSCLMNLFLFYSDFKKANFCAFFNFSVGNYKINN